MEAFFSRLSSDQRSISTLLDGYLILTEAIPGTDLAHSLNESPHLSRLSFLLCAMKELEQTIFQDPLYLVYGG